MKTIAKEIGTENNSASQDLREFINIPSFVFKDRSLSVLEVMVEYMHTNRSLSIKEIALILNRDEKTIWTVYRRARLKRSGIMKKSGRREQ